MPVWKLIRRSYHINNQDYMNKIVFVTQSNLINNVRLLKISKYLHENGFYLEFIGWKRYSNDPDQHQYFNKMVYILENESNSKFKLLFSYIKFIFKTVYVLNFRIKQENDNAIYFAVNFFGAFAVYLNKLIHKDIRYIYEIRDEIIKSYKLPGFIRVILFNIDSRIKNKSIKVIHVEINRVSNNESNSIVILNSPFDFYNNEFIFREKKKCFAVTGWLNNTRGLESIYLFAKNNPDFNFIVAGKFIDKNIENKYLSLNNIELHDFMPQNDLFDLIKNCSGIFSLYDPSLEINRLAASNKLYDAMMLGIPVIVNSEIEAAKFVTNYKIGFVVNYIYDESWNKIIDTDKITINELGLNGRNLYETKFEFKSQLDTKLLPLIIEVIK